jgi:enoyl-CoA hydratase
MERRMSDPVDEVRYERVGHAALVTIDRQHRRNAIDGPTAGRLAGALERFEADESAVALVLTGAGEAFCAGADLTAIESLAPGLEGDDGPLGFTRRVASKPTIAAIDGWAVAGGLELALWCDLRFCTPRSRLGLLERRFGVPLVDGGTWRLPQVVGLGRALELILTGRVVEPVEASAIGLVNAVVGDAVAHALALVETLAAYPQPTMLSDRLAVYDGLGRDRADALAREAARGLAVLGTAVEGAARFASGAGRSGT